MEKITSVNELHEAIARLENRKAEEWQALKENAHAVSESLQPANLVKKLVGDLASSKQLKNDLLDAGIGVATGLLAKKLVTAGSRNPVTGFVGNVIETLIAKAVSQNPDGIKTIGRLLLKKVLGKGSEEKAD